MKLKPLWDPCDEWHTNKHRPITFTFVHNGNHSWFIVCVVLWVYYLPHLDLFVLFDANLPQSAS